MERSNEFVTVTFRRGADGRMLFFPWGPFGRGYVLESDESYAKLRRRMILSFVLYFVLVVGVWTWYGPAVGMAVASFMVTASAVWLLRYTRRLEPSDESLSILESWRHQAESSRITTLWILEIAGVLLVLAAVKILVGARGWGDWLTGGAGLVFFGICAAANTYMIIVKRRVR